jgi:hypothetical protein
MPVKRMRCVTPGAGHERSVPWTSRFPPRSTVVFAFGFSSTVWPAATVYPDGKLCVPDSTVTPKTRAGSSERIVDWAQSPAAIKAANTRTSLDVLRPFRRFPSGIVAPIDSASSPNFEWEIGIRSPVLRLDPVNFRGFSKLWTCVPRM